MRSVVASVVVTLALGCNGNDETAPIDEPVGDCAAGEWPRDDGTCMSAGLPIDQPCPPGEALHDGGACVPAGVPPEDCGEGFAHDGDRGCEPILPAEPCPIGLMAVPGEATCREVAPCAAGTWGDIPVESDTEYVNAAYTGMDSDGSALKPWITVQDAIDAAAPGAIVAIAQGSYVEDVWVTGKPVRLWGVCPERVAIVGTGAELAAVVVLGGAAGTSVQNLAIRGDGGGFGLTGSLDVRLERVWLNANADRSMNVEDAFGPTSITLRASLVEQNQGGGVVVSGAQAIVEESVVRDTVPDSFDSGRGVSIQNSFEGSPGTIVLRRSLVERNSESGVFVGASEATVEASVIRDTLPDGAGLTCGRGVIVEESLEGVPASLVMRTSMVERNCDAGVFVSGSTATIEASVVRDTLCNAEGRKGRGIQVQDSEVGVPSTLVVERSLLDGNRELGVSVSASQATVEASVVRNTLPNTQGYGGRGVNIQGDATTAAQSTLLLRASLVEGSHDVGIFLSGSDATVEASVVRNTLPHPLGDHGRGVHAQAHAATNGPSTLALRGSIVEQSHDAAVGVLGSNAEIDSCILRNTVPAPSGAFGSGVIVAFDRGGANATITATRIEQSALAAVAVWGARAAIGGSLLSCQAFDLDRETFQNTAAVLEDLGGNACGCPEAIGSCKAQSAGLEPPDALAVAD